jgi:hypothetical protein
MKIQRASCGGKNYETKMTGKEKKPHLKNN